MNKKIILLLVVVVVGAAIGGYFLFFAQKQSGSSPSSPSEKLKEVLGIQPSTKNWQTYTHSDAGLSIKYPEGYTVKDEVNSSGPLGQILQVLFQPPGPEDKPALWEGLPFIMLVAPETGYGDIEKEFKRQEQGAEYYEETSKLIAGVNGIEVRVGPNPKVGNLQHTLYVTIPHKNGRILFITFAKDRNQLEKEAVSFLDTILSTFKPK